MLTFKLNDTADFRVIGDVSYGVLEAALITMSNGLKVVFAHADEFGYLGLPYADIVKAQEMGWIVVCCYPKRVRARYPQLKVAGGWDEPTRAVGDLSGSASTIAVCPSSQTERTSELLRQLYEKQAERGTL